MRELTCTLLADGPSDSVLIGLLRWLLLEHTDKTAINIEFEPKNHLTSLGHSSYSASIKAAVDLFPCDLLFLHRDTEKKTRSDRINEIDRAIQEADLPRQMHVCVIPIRMTEAWFLFHEQAIRGASGNPNGKISLELPPLKKVENLPDPKAILDNLILQASGLGKRRLERLRPENRRKIIPDFISDYSPLRNLSAFRALETDVKKALSSLGIAVSSK